MQITKKDNIIFIWPEAFEEKNIKDMWLFHLFYGLSIFYDYNLHE